MVLLIGDHCSSKICRFLRWTRPTDRKVSNYDQFRDYNVADYLWNHLHLFQILFILIVSNRIHEGLRTYLYLHSGADYSGDTGSICVRSHETEKYDFPNCRETFRNAFIHEIRRVRHRPLITIDRPHQFCDRPLIYRPPRLLVSPAPATLNPPLFVLSIWFEFVEKEHFDQSSRRRRDSKSSPAYEESEFGRVELNAVIIH